MILHRKPVELVEQPLDGQVQGERFTAPASPTEINLYQVVRVAAGVVQPVQTTQTTGFFLALTDTSPGEHPEGSFVNNPDGSWFSARPTTIDVVSITGRLGIITAQGTLLAAHIGQAFGLLQVGRVTVLDLANPTVDAATILEVVEGSVGGQNARVLVRFL